MENESTILISVITATKNSSATILDCIDSVSMQSYSNVEHLIIDGQSWDGTIDILSAHSQKFSFMISESDQGIYDALNKGINYSKGDVIGFLHSDDVYSHVKVLSNIAKVFEDPNVSAVYGDLQYVLKNDLNYVIRNWASSKFYYKNLKLGWMPPHPTLYVRREWYKSIGSFDTSYRISADYLSILRMFSQKDFHPVYIPEVLVKMRSGGVSNRSIKNIIHKSREDLKTLHSTRIGGVGTLILKNLRKFCQLRIFN